ncbi:YdbH domain-containing protein [Rhodospirillum rubrum]|uniref:Uncharacterized protein n=1 Tax=Rhodospirillum rubrum (strain ATCC 11170 / ATH 1.1.1 / DSM 467 / LMG 4362 / NCIMB 8255 / S1) TaxID=269796 RepID=Q2RTW6_RHORT|nr:YdbH domain-containing protein [Rhodospirillum rubrum]ABC22429.1 hypothetical protein Rru_A1629 [Rhodospirillum rubrum ATCC 11170]AEO48147.1 hypothetical protein F11_08405 [Rhodospirillum rubrum F11]MBK5954010.1 hypothetical protein [Rhodospirillum rubrum]QXG82065.1 YdbH domain-containing protein [Rhodospirillum rubrum]HAQ00156.1 hypothetical protein [Rhodospirillum rubrum]
MSRRRLLLPLAGLGLIGLGAVTGVLAGRDQLALWILRDRLPAFGLPLIEAQSLHLGATGLTASGVRLEGGQTTIATLEAAFTPQGLIGGRIDSLTLDDVTSLGWPTAGVGPLRGSARAEDLGWSGGQITARVAADLHLDRLVFGSDDAPPAEGDALPRAAGGLVVEDIGLKVSGPLSWNRLSGAVVGDGLATTLSEARLLTAGGPVILTGVEGMVSGQIPPSATVPLTLALTAGQIEGLDIKADGLSGPLVVSDQGPSGALTARLTRLPGDEKPRAPLTLALSVDAQAGEGGRLPITARLDDKSGRLAVVVKGEMTPDTSAGQIKLAAKPMTFKAGALQPGDLHGVLNGLGTVAGTLAAKGDLSWDDKGVSENVQILFKDIDAVVQGIPLSGLNGVLRLDQLWPPSGPLQDASVAAIDLGVPLTALTVRYRPDGKGALRVETASLTLAGGRVSTGALRVPLAGGRMTIPLTIERVGLADLAALVKLDGLTAEGSLSGTVPLRLEPDGGVWIDNASLTSDAPGLLRYRPPSPPTTLAQGNQGVALLLLALDNFHYQSLGLTVNGASSAKLTLGLRVQGANPDLYGGYPVDLNVTLNGALAQLVRSNLQTYAIPDRIRENMDQFMDSLRQIEGDG